MARWEPLASAGSVPLARSSHTITAIGRKLFVFGGEHAPRTPISTDVHAYDMDEKKWSVVPLAANSPSPAARVAHAAAAVGSRLFIFGGREGVDESKPLGDLWSLDTETRTWECIAPAAGEATPPPRSYHTMAAHEGSVYVFGGCGTGWRLNDLWAFDVAGRRWKALPASDAIKGRGGSTLAAAGGSLWVVAGFCGHELSDTHRFDLATQTWEVVEAESASFTPRSVAALAAAGPARSRLVLFGGELAPSKDGHAGAGQFTSEVYELDTAKPVAPGGAAWRRLTPAGAEAPLGPSKRGWLAATATEDGGFVVHGGNDESNVRLADGFVLSGL